jgi:hypothetical protein
MKKLTVFFALVLVFTVSACVTNDVEKETTILNGGFEEGLTETWEGWTRDGAAFSPIGVVSDETSNGINVEKTETYWFSGLAGGTQRMTGQLVSNEFKLTGEGYIAFKMGAAKNDTISVNFYIVGNDTPVATVTNTDFNEPYITVQLIRKIVDLRPHLDKDMYIRVIDNDDTDDFGYVNLDDFVIVENDTQLAIYQTERTEQLDRLKEPDFEEDPTLTTIVNGGFETGDLTGWKIMSGSAFSDLAVVSTSQLYWDTAKVYGWGDYYLDGANNGEIPESYIGSMRSTKFTLAGDGWISFMIGGSPNLAYVAINDGETGNELIKVYNETFNDPKLPLTLRRVYVDASAYLGQVLYISIVDEKASGGFAFITADDFRVSLTDEDVQSLMVEQYNAIMAETHDSPYGNLAAIRNYYINYDYPFELPVLAFTSLVSNKVLPASDSFDLTQFLSEATATFGLQIATIEITSVMFNEEETLTGFSTFDLSLEGTYEIFYTATFNNDTVTASFLIQVSSAVNVANGGFELGDLTGWTVIDGNVELASAVIGASTFWNEQIPYNQGGDFHFDGWSANGAEPEGYALQSSSFTLSGSGWMSFRMGGNAAYLKVYLAENDELIGYYMNTKFADINFPFVGQGSRLATMTTFFADLSTHLGQELYVVIGDDANVSGWAVAFFDEINTYYEEQPTLGYDEVTEANGGELVQLHHELAVNAMITNGGFETGNLAGWTVLTGNPDTSSVVISATTFWGENISYNQTGDYHLNGWNAGISEPEGFSLKSTNFMLRGSGWISFQLGGNAAFIKVYRASDDTLLGSYVNSEFADINFPYLSAGSRLATMNTYFADLSEYVGEELYIIIGDDSEVSGWAVAFIDTIQTYYDLTPSLTFDLVNDSGDKNEEFVELPHIIAVNLVTE